MVIFGEWRELEMAGALSLTKNSSSSTILFSTWLGRQVQPKITLDTDFYSRLGSGTKLNQENQFIHDFILDLAQEQS